MTEFLLPTIPSGQGAACLCPIMHPCCPRRGLTPWRATTLRVSPFGRPPSHWSSTPRCCRTTCLPSPSTAPLFPRTTPRPRFSLEPWSCTATVGNMVALVSDCVGAILSPPSSTPSPPPLYNATPHRSYHHHRWSAICICWSLSTRHRLVHCAWCCVRCRWCHYRRLLWPPSGGGKLVPGCVSKSDAAAAGRHVSGLHCHSGRVRVSFLLWLP